MKSRRKKHEFSQSIGDDDGRISDTSPLDPSSNSQEGHDCRRGRTGNWEDKLNVFLLVNYCFTVPVDYRTYQLADNFSKYDRIVSENVEKIGKAFDRPYET